MTRVNMAGPGLVGPIGPRPSRTPIFRDEAHLLDRKEELTEDNEDQHYFIRDLNVMEFVMWLFFFVSIIIILLVLTGKI